MIQPGTREKRQYLDFGDSLKFREIRLSHVNSAILYDKRYLEKEREETTLTFIIRSVLL